MLLLLVAALIAASAAAGQNPENAPVAKQLAAVRALYANASYEEALTALDAIPAADSTAFVDQYRALCYLALNRLPETERALERIIRRTPLHRMSEADVSPRLVAMFGQVRRRVLPAAAKETYARARWSFQGGDYETAAADLRLVLAILADPDLADAGRDLHDLKLIAEGFLKLANAELDRAPRRSAATPNLPGSPPAPAATSGSAGANGSPARIYDDLDTDVKAPIELSREMPLWTPPEGYKGGEFRGALELVIDEAGNVVSAVSIGPIMPNFDHTIRAAARQWKYRPAMLLNGTPVRYRLLVGYLLKPLGSPTK
jgi:tetratricopeptide (TPR) repeat protein